VLCIDYIVDDGVIYIVSMSIQLIVEGRDIYISVLQLYYQWSIAII